MKVLTSYRRSTITELNNPSADHIPLEIKEEKGDQNYAQKL